MRVLHVEICAYLIRIWKFSLHFILNNDFLCSKFFYIIRDRLNHSACIHINTYPPESASLWGYTKYIIFYGSYQRERQEWKPSENEYFRTLTHKLTFISTICRIIYFDEAKCSWNGSLYLYTEELFHEGDLPLGSNEVTYHNQMSVDYWRKILKFLFKINIRSVL